MTISIITNQRFVLKTTDPTLLQNPSLAFTSTHPHHNPTIKHPVSDISTVLSTHTHTHALYTATSVKPGSFREVCSVVYNLMTHTRGAPTTRPQGVTRWEPLAVQRFAAKLFHLSLSLSHSRLIYGEEREKDTRRDWPRARVSLFYEWAASSTWGRQRSQVVIH